MANRRFPRNNNRNISRSNNNRANNNIYCPQCSQRVQILDGDIQYSLNLHMQSHKPLASIDQDIGRQLSRANLGPNCQRNVQSNYFCPECNENIVVYGSDVKRFLELHAKKHKRSEMGTRDDQSSTSSGRSRNSSRNQSYVKNYSHKKSEGNNVLDNTFYKMPPGLKAHRGFVSENETGELVCMLCNLKIDSLNNISDHLVTKSHEDNTISIIKSKLPNELDETMHFVSFYGSNLCCNLCRHKIDLSSLNLSETIVNIIAHNSGHQHVKNTKRNKPLDPSEEGLKKLNFLASKDSLISENKHMISCEMQPQFKCKFCDKLIIFDQNDRMLLKNFTSHFSSNGHNKCVRATSVLSKFKNTYHIKGDKHNFVINKGLITCTVCNVSLIPSEETLDAHVKETGMVANIDWPKDTHARFNNSDFKNPQLFFNIREKSNENVENEVSKLTALLKCMPQPFTNVNYIVESSPGKVTCLICNSVVPLTFYYLKTHLTGNTHTMNLSCTKVEFGDVSPPNHNSTTTSAKSQSFNPFMKENSSPTMNVIHETENSLSEVLNYLKRSDPLIRKNIFLLTKHDNDIYSCNLCKMTLPKFHDLELLKEDLIGHFSGSKHLKLADEKLELEITKLITLDPLVIANRQYLRKLDDSLYCMLCDSPLSVSIDGAKLKRNLTEHLKGQQHLNNVKEITANQETPKPTPFLSNSKESLKDQYHLSRATEFADNSTKSSNMFKVNLKQLKGLQEFDQLEDSISTSQKPSGLLPNTTEPLKSSDDNEFTNNATEPFNIFQTPLKSFKGPQNLSKSGNSTNSLEKPDFLFPNVTDPFRTINFTNNAAKSSKIFQIPGDQLKELQDLMKSEESSNKSNKPSFLLPNPTEALKTKEVSNNDTQSSNMFKPPVEQFKGPQNLSKTEESTHKSQEPISLLPNLTEPLGELSVNVKLNELNSEPPKLVLPYTMSTDPVMELFRNMPANFQSDIAFIKKSSADEEYFDCTLCNVNRINPFHLQIHLEEEKHVQGKIARRAPRQVDTQNSTKGKKMVQNMKDFFGFSK